MTPQEFYQLLSQQGIELTDHQKDQFERYYELLVEWNEKINLTAITEKNEVYLKHFYDSIAPVLQDLIDNQELKLLDIGAGAGFPSLPMKIICPQLDVTIIAVSYTHLKSADPQIFLIHIVEVINLSPLVRPPSH